MNTAITTNNKYYKSENEKMQIHNFVQSQALFKSALENGLKITESVCKIAAQYGRVEVLKLIKDMGMLYSSALISSAAEGGNLENVKYLVSQGWDNFINDITFINAAEGGNLEIVKYLCELKKELCTVDACNAAARNGYFDILKFLHKQGIECNERTIEEAAYYDHFEMFKYLHEVVHCPWNEDVYSAAAKIGKMEFIIYAFNNGCPYDVSACNGAAARGNIDVLDELLAHDFPCDESTCDIAAWFGQTSTLKYLLKCGIPIDENAISSAARMNHFDTLKFLCESGCPIDDHNATRYAAQKNNIVMLKYLYEEQHCTLSPKVLLCAAYNNNLEMFKYAYEQGCTSYLCDSITVVKLFKYLEIDNYIEKNCKRAF